MVNARVNAKRLPAKAANLEMIFDLILQVLNIIEAIGRIFGISFNIGG